MESLALFCLSLFPPEFPLSSQPGVLPRSPSWESGKKQAASNKNWEDKRKYAKKNVRRGRPEGCSRSGLGLSACVLAHYGCFQTLAKALRPSDCADGTKWEASIRSIKPGASPGWVLFRSDGPPKLQTPAKALRPSDFADGDEAGGEHHERQAGCFSGLGAFPLRWPPYAPNAWPFAPVIGPSASAGCFSGQMAPLSSKRLETMGRGGRRAS